MAAPVESLAVVVPLRFYAARPEFMEALAGVMRGKGSEGFNEVSLPLSQVKLEERGAREALLELCATREIAVRYRSA